MSTNIVIPSLGESISEAVIASWLKPDGAFVRRDEEIVELETDKVTMPLPAPASGVLKHSHAQGATLKVGAVLGEIDESVKAPPPSSTPSTPTTASATTGVPKAAHSSVPAPVAIGAEDVRVTPLAKKLAEERGVDISRITGTGPGGRIREQDVLAQAASKTNGPADPPAAPPRTDSAPARIPDPARRGVSRERMSPLRQRIAVRLVEAQHTAAMLTTFNECDMTSVMELRLRHKDAFEKRFAVKLGFMSFFIKAAVSALEKFPLVNASIVENAGVPEVELHHYCDIAVAVGTEKGLVVPVLRNCHSLSFAEVEAGINTLASRARDGRLTLDDLQGGTFTISNGGVYGSMMSTPILNPPQSGILGMHNIIRRPVENPQRPGSGEVVVRPMMYLALSYDHRIVDGAGAVGFLKHIKECIEEPARLLLEL